MAAAAVPVRVTELDGGGSSSVWVNGAAGSLEEFEKFETEFSSVCKKSVYSRNIFAFREKELVAVKGKSVHSEVWYRAEVQCRFEGERYKVFLVDYGSKWCRKSSYILPCPEEFASFPYQARLVCLYGLIPTTIDFDLADEKAPTQIVRSDQWTCQAGQFIDLFIKSYEKAFFVPGPELVSDELEVFGDLVFEVHGTKFSLSDELVKKKFALRCPEDFEKDLAAARERQARSRERRQPSEEESAPSAEAVASEKTTLEKMRQELREKSSKILNCKSGSESGASQHTEEPASKAAPTPVTPPTAAPPKKTLTEYLSRIISSDPEPQPQPEPVVSNSSSRSSIREGACPPRKVAIIPAGFEIVCEKKDAENPHIVYKVATGNSAAGEPSTPPSQGQAHDDQGEKRLSARDTSASESESADRSLSATTRTSVDTSDKDSQRSADTNKLFMLLAKTRRSGNSGSESGRNAPDGTTSGTESSVSVTSPAQNATAHRNRRNLLDILDKVSSSASTGTSRKSDPSEPAEPRCAESPASAIASALTSATRDTVPPAVFGRLEPRRGPREHLTLLERNRPGRVLVHGGIASKPWSTVSESKLHPAIKKVLADRGVDVLTPLQSYVWPAIKKRQNLVFVGRKTQGKLLSYVAPVVDFVIDAEKPEGNGPLAIIVCPGYNQAHRTYDLCKRVISTYEERKSVRILKLYNSTLSLEDTINCINGCELLVTTPRCLIKLMQFSTNFRRLGLFVCDNADVLLSKFLLEVKAILKGVTETAELRKDDGEIVQLVACCNKWIPRVKEFTLKYPANPTVIISCPLEAALYAEMKPRLDVVEDRSKTQHLLNILDSFVNPQKVIIFCSSPTQVQSLAESLRTHSLYVLQTSDDSKMSELEAVKRDWDEGAAPNFPVLVCTDSEFLELNIRDATYLIHYSMRPTGTKSQFGSRFSCVMANYPSIFQKRIACPETHILLDETNDHQLPGVINFIQRSGTQDDKLVQFAEEGRIRREKDKKSSPLCLEVEMFGDCWDERACPDRHILLPEVDAPPSHLPRSGWVKLKILRTVSASHLTGRIVEHAESDGDFKKVRSDYVSIAMRMAKTFSDSAEIVRHGSAQVGDMCAVRDDENNSMFHRAAVVKVEKGDRKPDTCIVRRLDDACLLRKKVSDLYFLPEELRAFPPQAVDIFVCGLKPKDLDDAWSTEVTEKVNHWTQEADCASRDNYFKGKVVLSLRDKIWVDPLELYRKLNNVRTHVVTRSIRIDLLKENLAVDNPNHAQKLYDLCLKSGLQDLVPEKPSGTPRKTVHEAKQPEPQWAHLDVDVFELTEFVYAENPRLFFLRRDYTTETFDALTKDLQTVGQSRAGSETVFRRGRVCLALCSGDNQWARAVMNSAGENGTVPVFFVDFGDSEDVAVDCIAAIPNELITRLPFQAIECSLAGIRPKGTSWSDDARDFLYDMCEGKKLYVKPVLATAGELTSGKHYLVVLLDTTGEGEVVINDLFINDNLAEPEEEESKYMQNATSGPIAAVNEALYTRDESDNEVEVEVPAEAESAAMEVAADAPLASPAFYADNNQLDRDNIVTINGYEINIDDFDIEDVSEFLCEGMADKRDQATNSLEGGQTRAALPAPPAESQAAVPAARRDEESNSRSPSPSPSALPSQGKRLPTLLPARAPAVKWSQDLFTLSVEIRPGVNIEDYYLRWTTNRIQFSACEADGAKCFHADLALCGTIMPEEVKHSMLGNVVKISAQKALTGWFWPRLLRPQIQPKWLIHDAAKEVQSSDSEDHWTSEKIVDRASKSGTKLKKRQRNSLVRPVLDAALSSEDNESDPDFMEHDDQAYGLLHGVSPKK